MMRRILCVWLPYWATTRLRHARTRAGAPPDEALATIQTQRGVRRLAAICPIAESHGLHPGQTLTQARAIHPALVAAEAEPEADAAALADLALWCTRATPLAAPAPPDVLWLDIAGCAHLQGGEAALATDLATRMAKWNLQTNWAIAPTTGAAYALAHAAPTTIIPPGGQAAAIAALPIELLRLAPAATAGLRRLGLKTIGALARLPRGELAARFGAATLLRLDQAQGEVVEPITWPAPPTDWTEREAFAEPILTTESCLHVLDRLARRLCARLAAQHQGGRQFVATFTRVDATIQTRAIATSLPVRDPAYLCKLLAETLEGLDPGFGIEAIALAAPAIAASGAEQPDFAGGAHSGQQRLAQLIDALSNRLSACRLWRYAPRESHIPERATQRAPALAAAITWQDDPDTPRPIRLLRRPERIEVTALLPDDPPVQFRWRGALHRVRAATGPERIGAEWWTSQTGGTRDYYQVEDSKGARYWMFRDEAAWWLHGLFG
jgi:protein ImuB